MDRSFVSFRAGSHGQELNLFLEEYREPGSGLGRRKNGVDGMDQSLLGAPVCAQRVAIARRGGFGRLQIGVDVRAAKPVDGLLGIPNEIKPMAALGFSKDPFKDFPLERIGVLRFVNERGVITLAQRVGQGFATGAG